MTNTETPKAPDTRTWRYHPDGRAEIFPDYKAAADAEADGWFDHPDKAKAARGSEKTVDVVDVMNASDAAVKLASDEGIDLKTVKGTGKDGGITKKDVELAIEARDAGV